MPSEFTSASKYKPDKKSKENTLPILTGVLIILVAMKYLAASFVALGMGESFYFITTFLIFILTAASFVLLRRGLLLEIIYNRSKYAKSSKYPYKTMGAIILSTATMFSAYLGEYSLVASSLLGLSVLVGWYLYYRFDPMDDKIDGYDSDKSAQRIMKLLIEANEDISDIKEYAKEIKGSTVAPLMKEMADEFYKIVEHIQNEPDDYDTAHKYLVSYLKELKSMSKTFVKLDAKEKSQEIESAFKEVLQESITKLQNQYDKLLDDDILDLDIKLSVMKKRFKNEE